jgi:hypothetical protein
VVDGYGVEPKDLFTYYDDAFRAASDLRQAGLTALMMITQLSSGLNPGGINELVSLQRDHVTALGDAHGVLDDSSAGISFLALGAGLIGYGYQATDGAAADKINGSLVDKLLAPPPAGQQPPPTNPKDAPPPLTEEEKRQLENIANTLGGKGTKAGGATRVMNMTNGAVTVTVPAVPAMPKPPLPGRDPKSTSTAPPSAPPATTYTTDRENELDPDKPAVCAAPLGSHLPCEGNYNDQLFRTAPPDLPKLEKK